MFSNRSKIIVGMFCLLLIGLGCRRKPRVNPLDPQGGAEHLLWTPTLTLTTTDFLTFTLTPTLSPTPTLTPTPALGGPDTFESDDAYGSASPLLSGVQQDHSLHAVNDVDWAVFTLGQTTEVSLETLGASGDTILTLYSSAGVPSTPLASDDDSGPGLFSGLVILLGPGTYYVRIQEKGQDAPIQSYGLTLSIAIPTPTSTPTATAVPCSGGLAGGVDHGTLTFTTGGTTNWFCETVTTFAAGDAIEGGNIADSQSTWTQATVTGPGTLTFYWRVSSEANYDYLYFQIDGVSQAWISGTVAWTQRTYPISSGSHNLRWLYMKDSTVSTGSDTGWIDAVTFP